MQSAGPCTRRTRKAVFEIGLGNLTKDEARDVLGLLRMMQIHRGTLPDQFAPYNPEAAAQPNVMTAVEIAKALGIDEERLMEIVRGEKKVVVI
jgi:hypothetical protein